jgi:glycyl-tRNA synthetase beta chain
VRELGGVARLARALAAADAAQLQELHTVYTRADRLGGRADDVAAKLDRALLTDVAERDVADALERLEAELAVRLPAQEFEQALRSAAELAAPLARFFDEVLVMAEDSAVRANRLRLLVDVRDALHSVADFGQLQL